jgi:hypothetical protein
VQFNAGMLGQPGPHDRVLVGGVVVADHVQLAAWIGPGDLLEEGQELLVTVAWGAPVDNAPGRDLQRSEQRRGAVPGVVVGALLGPIQPDSADRLGAFQAWIWDFSSTQSTTARAGGCRYSPTTSWTLAASCGSVENLKVSARHGLIPYSRQTRAMVSRLTPSSPASSRVDQWVIPSRGGGGLSVTLRISARWVRRTVCGMISRYGDLFDDPDDGRAARP